MAFDLITDDFDLESNDLTKELIPTDEELENLPKPVQQTEELPAVVDDCAPGEESEVDFDKVRKNLQKIIDKGIKSLDSLKILADGSDDPRAFDAMSKLMKSLTDANKQLFELHKMRQDLNRVEQSGGLPAINGAAKVIQNNVVFSGTTKELLEHILKK